MLGVVSHVDADDCDLLLERASRDEAGDEEEHGKERKHGERSRGRVEDDGCSVTHDVGVCSCKRVVRRGMDSFQAERPTSLPGLE